MDAVVELTLARVRKSSPTFRQAQDSRSKNHVTVSREFQDYTLVRTADGGLSSGPSRTRPAPTKAARRQPTGFARTPQPRRWRTPGFTGLGHLSGEAMPRRPLPRARRETHSGLSRAEGQASVPEHDTRAAGGLQPTADAVGLLLVRGRQADLEERRRAAAAAHLAHHHRRPGQIAGNFRCTAAKLAMARSSEKLPATCTPHGAQGPFGIRGHDRRPRARLGERRGDGQA